MSRRGWTLELAFFALSAGCFLGVGFSQAFGPEPWRPTERTPRLLRIMTWNVGQGLDRGGGGLRADQLNEVAETLREIDPDLAFLQELTTLGQLHDLRGLLGEGWRVEGSRRHEGRRVGVLARRGDLEVERLDRADRALLVRYLRPGRALAAVGVHASAFSAEERNRVLGSALTQLVELEPPGPRLLMGDLNLDLDLDQRRDLFTDDEYLDVETYNFLAGRLSDLGRGQGPTAEPDRRLDYLFASPEDFQVLSVGPLQGKRLAGMDHDPVLADLTWGD